MKIGQLKRLNKFFLLVNSCKGIVWIKTPEGDRYNLNSALNQCIIFDILLEDRHREFELTCSDKDDEKMFEEFMKGEKKSNMTGGI